jgi:hypothetical protein
MRGITAKGVKRSAELKIGVDLLPFWYISVAQKITWA